MAVLPKQNWVSQAMMGSNPLLEYLILQHMRIHPSHSIPVELGLGITVPLSGFIMNALRKSAETHGITLDEAFNQRLPYLEGKI